MKATLSLFTLRYLQVGIVRISEAFAEVVQRHGALLTEFTWKTWQS